MRQNANSAAVSKHASNVSSCTARAVCIQSIVVTSAMPVSVPTARPPSSVPNAIPIATVPTPASAAGRRAANSETRPSGAPAAAASQ
jgi:hypothetical protein